MIRKCAEFVLLIKWPLFQGLMLATLMAGFAATHLAIDPTVESLFIKKSDEYRYYREYRDRYGSDQLVAVAMETTDLFTQRNLKLLKKVSDHIAAAPQVENVLSLARVMDIHSKFLGVKIVPALAGVFEGTRTLEDARNAILSNELYVNNLVSKDGKHANIVLKLKASSSRGKGADFIKDLRGFLAEEEIPGVKFYVAGAPVEQYDFVRLIRKDQFTFVPMITVLLVLTTWLIYRSFACVVLAMTAVFMTLIWTFGLISSLGKELNLVTSLLAPVIMIVSVVDVIYFIGFFLNIRAHHASVRQSVILTMEQLVLPCFLTHMTACLGFVSLSFSKVPAIQEFGLFAACGIAFSYIITILLTPVMLPILPYRIKRTLSEEGHFFNKFVIHFVERLEFQGKWLILVSVIGCVIFSYMGIRKLNVDTNIVKQMKPNSPLAVATHFIDKNITGVYTLGFVLRTRNGETIDDPQVLERIDAFKSFLESMPAIAKVNCITPLVKRIHEVRGGSPEDYKIPRDPQMVKLYFKGIIENADDELWSMISRDLREVNVQAQMHAVGTRDGATVEEASRRYMKEVLSPYFDCHMTGNVVLLGRMSKDLVESQIQGFSFAFLATLTLVALIFGSLHMGLLAAIPNLLPIGMVYGMMGFMGIELSSSTAMIASIVLGIIVDSSIHFLYRLRREYEQRENYLQALHHTYRSMGQSLVLSTLILISGFSTSVFAGFRPTIQFGILTSLAIFLSMTSTLLVLPVCAVITKPFGRSNLFRRKRRTKRVLGESENAMSPPGAH
ncbi:MAG TPA: MMPL family transporter [Verrucomicrobiae bacterium]|nr:MMPL family transporter [Verrucomicrobiae bacterium]